jgi:hypothetical protein
MPKTTLTPSATTSHTLSPARASGAGSGGLAPRPCPAAHAREPAPNWPPTFPPPALFARPQPRRGVSVQGESRELAPRRPCSHMVVAPVQGRPRDRTARHAFLLQPPSYQTGPGSQRPGRSRRCHSRRPRRPSRLAGAPHHPLRPDPPAPARPSSIREPGARRRLCWPATAWNVRAGNALLSRAC